MRLQLLFVVLGLALLSAAAPFRKTPHHRFAKPLNGPPAGWKAGTVCDMAGTWAFAEPDIALYTITHSGSLTSNTYFIGCSEGCSWKSANMTVNADGKLDVLFDSGFKDTGYMLADCTVIAWADGSYWMLHQHAQCRTCDLTGRWLYGDGASVYLISRKGASAFEARCVGGDCNPWKTAQLTLADSGKVEVRFDTGFVDQGEVSSDCVWLMWGDRSRWQHQPMNITVHLVPQSHNDPGWLETVEEYYDHYVRKIYSGVVQSLMDDPKRSFCGEVVSFWKMWWEDPAVDAKLKEAVPRLVKSGQLAMAGAGHTSPDEAIVWFGDNLDLSVFGHLWLKSQWGYQTSVGWQADPFGHSSSQALVWALSGFNAFMFGRPAANTDRINRELAQVWHPTQSFSSDFDHSLLFYNHPVQYCQPWGDCVGMIRKDDYEGGAKCLLHYLQDRVRAPWANHAMVMFGCDFEWQDAITLYPKVDKTIALFNQKYPDLHLVYSTPDRFFAALYADKLTFASRNDADTFPHQGNGMPWWTGFYTSRPEFKFAWHQASAFLHAAQELHAVTRLSTWKEQFANLSTLWDAVGLVQHHDAITGDSKQYVTVNYGDIVQRAVQKTVPVVQNTLAKLRNTHAAQPPVVCYNATTVPCPALVKMLQSGQCASLTAFNPLAWTRNTFVRVRVPSASVSVRDATGATLAAQTSLVSAGVYELVFLATQLPPVGFNVYTVCPTASILTQESRGVHRLSNEAVIMENSKLKLEFTEVGTLAHMTNKVAGVDVQASAKVKYYHCKAGNENAWDFSTDGISTPSDFPQSGTQHVVSHTTGPCFEDLMVSIDESNGIFVHYRLYKDEDHFMVRVGAGPFDNTLVKDSVDVMLILQTNIDNKQVWFTDSQGLEMKERRYNWRQWQLMHLDPSYPVAANTYPVTTAARMSDTRASLLLLTRNTHGVACMANGEMEVMVHRYWHDDAPMMNPNVYDEGTFWVQLDTPNNIIDTERPNSYLFQNPLVLSVEEHAGEVGVASYTALTAALPPQLHLLTTQTMPQSFSTLPDGTTIVRLQHMYAKGEGKYAVPVTFDLATLFRGLPIKSAVEYTANGLKPMAQAQAARYKWKEENGVAVTSHSQDEPSGPALSVTLQPLDIKTYMVTF